MHWYFDVLKKYATFSGRASRSEYWMFFLINMVVATVLFYGGTALVSTKIGYSLYGLYCLAIILPALAVTVRRLHDVGKSGWWWFISLIPVAGGIWLFVLTVLDSKPGDNQYGPNPKGVGIASATM